MKALHIAGIALAAVLAGCGTVQKQQAALVGAPQAFPTSVYERAAAQGEAVYRIDAANSLVVLTVRRGGSLARFGHDHVIASRSVQGYVAPAQGRADLYLPLAELTVDEPELRTEAGLDTQPSASDIEGTRANMLDKVLRVTEFPHALVQVRDVDAKAPSSGTVSITLLGTTRTSTIPLSLTMTRDSIRATGTMELKQSDFGIVPFSLFGGALQVKDEFELRFDVRARAQPSP